MGGNGVGLGGTGSDWGDGVGLGGNGVGLGGTWSDWGERGQTGGNEVGLGGNGVELGGRNGGVGRGYKRKGQLIWPHSLPLTAPRPLASN